MSPDPFGEAPGVPADPPASGLCVGVPVADLWAEPAPGAERVSQVLLGAPLVCLEERDGSLCVASPDRYHGWIRAGETAEAPGGEGEVRMVGALRTPLYQYPEGGEPAGEVYFSTRLTAVELFAGRRRVLLPAGEALMEAEDALWPGGEAWIPEACLRPPVPPECPIDVAQMLEDARLFLGVPYLWGGGSARGIDCSGFVQVLLRSQGRELLRDANLQTRHGQPVAPAELEAGDIVFFGRSQKGMPTHVGLFLGGGEYIHAHGGEVRKVEISPFAAALEAGTFWGARRLR